MVEESASTVEEKTWNKPKEEIEKQVNIASRTFASWDLTVDQMAKCTMNKDRKAVIDKHIDHTNNTGK